MTTPLFYQQQLDRFIERWHLVGDIYIGTDAKWYEVRLHVGRFRDSAVVGDIYQQARRVIISSTDLSEVVGKIETGDKVRYNDKISTIDLVDPRIEVGVTIGYDLTCRGAD